MSCTIFRSLIINVVSVCKMFFFPLVTFESDAGSTEFPFIVSFYVRQESKS